MQYFPPLHSNLRGPLPIKRDTIHACQIKEDNLRFYVLFNSVSVMSGQWRADNSILSAMEPFTIGKIIASSKSRTKNR